MYKINVIEYPNFTNHKKELKGHLCYYIKPYPLDIISVYIGKFGSEYVLKVLDKFAKDQNLNLLDDTTKRFLNKNLMALVAINKNLRINQSQLFFSRTNDGFILVDVFDITSDKFIGPGMLKDVYGKRIDIQKVIEIKEYDENAKNIMIKPSKFMSANLDGKMVPLYIKC